MRGNNTYCWGCGVLLPTITDEELIKYVPKKKIRSRSSKATLGRGKSKRGAKIV